ncbi:hypothetical protein N7492_001838 [Penicillium capsulatum]|uniref:Uncharacterized protein n=1 Tax=Penicillium capsulatum TaxID=69766 RepID=A0A9W9M1K7_9EURO|nr:hypothetical protein N7492_001838 [Penicillium capsulatum]KAJ6129112.1 hypothetical protein N7512_001892 [Penicillium capsulatum]
MVVDLVPITTTAKEESGVTIDPITSAPCLAHCRAGDAQQAVDRQGEKEISENNNSLFSSARVNNSLFRSANSLLRTGVFFPIPPRVRRPRLHPPPTWGAKVWADESRRFQESHRSGQNLLRDLVAPAKKTPKTPRLFARFFFFLFFLSPAWHAEPDPSVRQPPTFASRPPRSLTSQ